MNTGYLKNYKRNTGLSLVEVLIAASIFVGAVVVFSSAIQIFFDLQRHSAQVTQAGLLLEEGAEAVQLLRDNGWDTYIETLTLDTPYSLYWDGNNYAATTTDMTVQGSFKRIITLQEVERDGSDSITSSGTVDPNTRLVTIDIYSVQEDELVVTADVLIHNMYEN